MPDMESPKLSHRLAKALAHRGFTRANLADALGVSRSTVDKWMLGDRTPETETLERISLVLSVRAAWLAFGEGEGP